MNNKAYDFHWRIELNSIEQMIWMTPSPRISPRNWLSRSASSWSWSVLEDTQTETQSYKTFPNGRDKSRQTTILKKSTTTLSLTHRSSSVAGRTWRIWISFKVTMCAYVITKLINSTEPWIPLNNWYGWRRPPGRSDLDYTWSLSVFHNIRE